MAKDVQRTKRIAHVLGLLEQVGRRDLVESTRLADEAKRSHDEVLASLTADEFLSGPFIDLIARRLPRLAVAVEVENRRKAAALQVWQDRQMRATASERLVDNARIGEDRDREGRELEALLEILQSRQVQGSGKSNG